MPKFSALRYLRYPRSSINLILKLPSLLYFIFERPSSLTFHQVCSLLVKSDHPLSSLQTSFRYFFRMSSPSTTPPSIRIRKRAATKVLLGSDYEEVIRTTPSPPVPMEKAEEYTLSRVKAGLLYADNILRNTIRKLSPLGQRALALYKENCATLLDLGEGELNENGEDAETLKLQLIAQIRSYEADLQYHGFMKLLPPANDQDLIDKILHLKRVEFYARYADILARFCTKLKVAANVNKTPGHRMLMAYWTKTEKELNDELTSFNAYRRGEVEKGSECKTTLAVYHACRHIGIEFDDMRSIISMYATQNSMLHEDLDNLVRGKRYVHLIKASLKG